VIPHSTRAVAEPGVGVSRVSRHTRPVDKGALFEKIRSKHVVNAVAVSINISGNA